MLDRILPRSNYYFFSFPLREERDAVQPRPLCELVLDWAHQKWLDDDSVEIGKKHALKKYDQFALNTSFFFF